MQQHDFLYLSDIVKTADELDLVIVGLDRATVAHDDTLRSAVLMKLIIIGEAVAQVSGDVRDRHPEIPWRDIVGFRNIAIHRYFGVDWTIVCDAAFDDVPPLREAVKAILASESVGD